MSVFNQVAENLLTANNVELSDLSRVLDCFSNKNIDFADIYFKSSRHESWYLDENIVKEGGFSIDKGFGIRANSFDKTGFAYSDQISNLQLEKCAKAAGLIGKDKSQKNIITDLTKKEIIRYYPAINPLESISQEQKIALLHKLNETARKLDKRIIKVNASIQMEYEEILVAGTDGTLAGDIRPMVQVVVSVLAEENGKRQKGYTFSGGRKGLDYFFEPKIVDGKILDLTNAEYLAHEAVRCAILNLNAIPAPSGSFPIVLGAGWPGIMLHEAVGHGLEGDFNRKNTSLFSGKIGELVTSELCTVVDDGTCQEARGSINIDDEGTPAQRNVLIENGILKGYMQDKLNARLMGVKPTGNGRRENYNALPMPRMTNTYLIEGNNTLEEMIDSVEFGIYAPNFSSGQVDITSGKFVFSTAEAYLIEKGKITQPVTEATLIGSGIEAMQQVSMIGKTMQLDNGGGTCGKASQSVPVCVGQPCVKMDKITIGGRG